MNRISVIWDDENPSWLVPIPPKKCIATSGNITLNRFSTKAIPSRLSLKRKKQPQDTHLHTFQAEPGPTSCRGCFQTPLLRWPFKALKGRYGWSFHSLIPSNPAMIFVFWSILKNLRLGIFSPQISLETPLKINSPWKMMGLEDDPFLLQGFFWENVLRQFNGFRFQQQKHHRCNDLFFKSGLVCLPHQVLQDASSKFEIAGLFNWLTWNEIILIRSLKAYVCQRMYKYIYIYMCTHYVG